MKTMTADETAAWILSTGRPYAAGDFMLYRFIVDGTSTAMVPIPQDVRELTEFAGALGGWFSPTQERLLWVDHNGLSSWNHYSWLNRLRGAGDTAPTLLQAPGTLFGPGGAFDEEDAVGTGPASRENADLTGLLFLLMSFDGLGFVVPREGNEFMMLDDEVVALGNLRPERRDAAAQLAASFGLTPRWAYSAKDFLPYRFLAGRVES